MRPLILLALFGGLVGFLSLSDATTGVGIVCLSCLAAILARIVQAADQHKELTALLQRQRAEREAS